MFFYCLMAMPQFSPMQLALMVVVILLAIMAPRMILRSRTRRRPHDLAELRERIDKAEHGSGARQKANHALTELLEASREINAQIDTKIRVLNKLVKDADNEARRLEKLLGVSSSDNNRKEGTGNRAVDIISNDAAREKPKSSQSARRCRDLCSRISHWQSAGKSVIEIAQITGLSIQEVSMLIQMGAVQAAAHGPDSGDANA